MSMLARIDEELRRISSIQHDLARRRALLQEQATKLRLGVSPLEVSLTLRAAVGIDAGRNFPAADAGTESMSSGARFEVRTA